MCKRTSDKVNYTHRRETHNKIHNITNPQRKTHRKREQERITSGKQQVTNKHIITSTATPRKNRDEQKQSITLHLNKEKVKYKTSKRTRPQFVHRNLAIAIDR
jgi:uncharacterized glyoxalase superfamily protein PhnB